MSLRAPDLFIQKRSNVNHLGVKSVLGKELSHFSHTQKITVVILHRPDHVVSDFVHLEKANTHSVSGDAANLTDCSLHSFDGQMLEKILKTAIS